MATIPATQPGQPAQEGQGVEREGKKHRKPNILRVCLQKKFPTKKTLPFTEFTFSFLYNGQTISNIGEKNYLWGQMLLSILHLFSKYGKPEMFHGLVFCFSDLRIFAHT